MTESEGKWINEFLHMLKQPLHITHAEKLGDEWRRDESFKIIEVFTHSQEDDRGLCCCNAVCSPKSSPFHVSSPSLARVTL
jgi:hypothetical protein